MPTSGLQGEVASSGATEGGAACLFLKWDAYFRKEYRVQAEHNRAVNPATPITYGILLGKADKFATAFSRQPSPVSRSG